MAFIQYLRFDGIFQQPKIVVQYFDTEDLALKGKEMYITGYKAKLSKDTSYSGLWKVLLREHQIGI